MSDNKGANMTSKTVYLVRRGSCGQDGLTAHGEQEIRRAAEFLRHRLASSATIAIYHGPQPGVTQSAQVLARSLSPIGATLIPRQELGYEGAMDESRARRSIDAVVAGIERCGIILSTQEDVVGYLWSLGKYTNLPPGGMTRLDL